MTKQKAIHWLLLSGAVFAILYVYFLPFETKTIYGDDLRFYVQQVRLKNFAQWLNCFAGERKYRPIVGITDYTLMHLLDKNLHGHYIFNILVQTGITVLFAAAVNTVARHFIFSALVALLAGTSRFALYNLTQIYWGGPMEGVAMLFFLWALYQLMRAFTETEGNTMRRLLLATLATNLAMYTHERYIVVFPFIAAVAVLYPFAGRLTVRQKITITAIAIFSAAANVLVKEYVVGIPFLVGTGTGEILFSAPVALGFLADGLMSVIQMNNGPEMLVGNRFATSQLGFQAIAIALAVFALAIFILFAIDAGRKSKECKPAFRPAYTILFLLMLLLLNMAPAVSTHHLEQRWLQAPLCIYILMVTVAACNIKRWPAKTTYSAYSLFLLMFIISDHEYLYKGTYKMFLMKSDKTATRLVAAARNGMLRPERTTLYIQEDWWLYTGFVCQDGDLFRYYGLPPKQVFTFTNDRNDAATYVVPLTDYVPEKSQVIWLREDTITDITAKYASSAK